MRKSKFGNILDYRNVFGKQYKLIYLIYFAFFLVSGPLESMLPLLFSEFGYSESTFGIFLALVSGVNIILPGVVGYISNSSNSSLLSILFMSLGFLILAVLGNYTFSMIVVIILLIIFSMTRTVFNYSFGNTVNFTIKPDERGKFFAARDLFLFGSISIGLFAGSFLLERYTLINVYSILKYVYILPIILILIYHKGYIKNINSTNRSDKTAKEKISISRIRKLFTNKTFVAFLVIQVGTTIYSVALSFLPLLALHIGISMSQIMKLLGAITLVNSIIAIFLGGISDKKGRKWFYVFDIGFDVLPAIVFALTRNIYLFVFGVILTMVKDALAPISFAYFFDCFDDDDGVFIMGVLASFGNLLGVVAPIVVGIIWAKHHQSVFLVGALGNILATLTAITLLPSKVNKEDSKEREVI